MSFKADRGVKQPTAAHRAIAELVNEGGSG